MHRLFKEHMLSFGRGIVLRDFIGVISSVNIYFSVLELNKIITHLTWEWSYIIQSKSSPILPKL